MILLCGIPSEGPLTMVAEALQAIDAPVLVLNQRLVASYGIEWTIDAGRVDGMLNLGCATYRLSEIEAVYVRLMDDRFLPELDGQPDTSPPRRHARGFHESLTRWLEVAPGRIVNRAEPQASNGSKPYQAQLIQAMGFAIPETLITNDPAAVRDFQSRHGAIIYKSMSSVRSIVKAFDDDDLGRLDDIGWCPVQFQALVAGTDIRVHVIGREVHATKILSDRVDYRYATRQGGQAELVATTIPDELAERCVDLTKALGLAFSGIDLRQTPAGEHVCFEVNPSPAFSYYQANTGQPIAASVARILAGDG